MNKYVIGDRVKCKSTNEQLIIVDSDITKNGDYIYLTSNKLWYDHRSIIEIDNSEIFNQSSTLSEDDDLETMVLECMKDPDYALDVINWLDSENRKYDEENKPTLKNWFNLGKLFKKKKWKYNGEFFN